MALSNAEIEKMSFREKQKYFEKQQAEAASSKPAKQFSYLSEHEIARMRQEEAKKVCGMSKAQILSSYVTGEDGDDEDQYPDDDMDKVLASLEAKRMKSLEVDAVQAQAVIAKAQEMSNAGLNSVDRIPLADADEGHHHPNHNGDSRVEMSGKPYYNRMGIGESQH